MTVTGFGMYGISKEQCYIKLNQFKWRYVCICNGMKTMNIKNSMCQDTYKAKMNEA